METTAVRALPHPKYINNSPPPSALDLRFEGTLQVSYHDMTFVTVLAHLDPTNEYISLEKVCAP